MPSTRGSAAPLVLSTGSVGVWDWNLETNQIYVDRALTRALGFADTKSSITSTHGASTRTPTMRTD